MSKPFSLWSWDSLKSWMVGRRRKPRKARRTRPMRMETLNQRIVLAADIVESIDSVVDQAVEVAVAISDIPNSDEEKPADVAMTSEDVPQACPL